MEALCGPLPSPSLLPHSSAEIFVTSKSSIIRCLLWMRRKFQWRLFLSFDQHSIFFYNNGAAISSLVKIPPFPPHSPKVSEVRMRVCVSDGKSGGVRRRIISVQLDKCRNPMQGWWLLWWLNACKAVFLLDLCEGLHMNRTGLWTCSARLGERICSIRKT